MGWKPEYLVQGKWCNNGVCFATEGEALNNARDQMLRWFVPEDCRAVEVDEPATHMYVDHTLTHLPKAVEEMNQLIEATLNQLVADIEGEKLDWRKTWIGGGMPENHTTNKRYRGVNVLLLWAAAQNNQFPTQQWATYKQWSAAGYQVGKGQKSSTIFIVKDIEKTDKVTGEDGSYRLLKCAFVFNAAQLVEPPALAESKEVSLIERHINCEHTVVSTGANLFTSEAPLYRPKTDMIGMPDISQFVNADCYYATLFHELVHWTGHTTRCDRKFELSHGTAYAFEELVAEFGAAFLSGIHGIREFPEHDNHVAYLQSWLTTFKKDKAGAVLKAARAAQTAIEFIDKCNQEQEAQAA